MSRTPTTEQQACVKALKERVQLLKISACAGSGKTSTLVMMAEAVDVPSLYLAFNKVTANEAAEKFPSHVVCKTTHSVAYAAFGAKLRDKLSRPPGRYQNVGWTGSEIGKLYEIESYETRTGETITAGHFGLIIRDTVARFEQSADTEIEEKHIPRGDLKEKLHDNVGNIAYCVDKILPLARRLWEDRINTKSVVQASHDTYLKLYQLSKPVLKGYDVLYVDEFQDTTPCVLDIVMNQAPHMQVVMVGDSRQAIYGWRGAVNAMAMVEAEERKLTKSFRYGQAIADIATAVLGRDMVITGNETIESRSGRCDLVDRTKSYTRLFRTNGALLSAAVPEILNGTKVALEIDVKDFVKLLFSAFSLAQGIKKDVKHDKVVPYLDWEELKADGTRNDPELKRVVKIVEEGKALEWIDILDNFSNAARPLVTFTTAHKSKGREWFQVIVEDDFKSGYDEEGDWIGLPTEEQNLLYVACTRAIDVLEYNETVSGYLKAREKDQKGGFAFRQLMRQLSNEGPKDGRSGALQGEYAMLAQEMEGGVLWD